MKDPPKQGLLTLGYIYIGYYGSNSEIKIRWVGVETYLRKSLDSTPEHDLVCGQ